MGASASDPSKPEWMMALENHAVTVEGRMRAMEERLTHLITHGVTSKGKSTGNNPKPAQPDLFGTSAMRAARPIISESSSEDKSDSDGSIGSPMSHATRSTRRANIPTPQRSHPREDYDSLDSYRRVLERIKSYSGPAFVLSRRRGKFADDWIRTFDNWFRARVCDPNIDDPTIRAGVLRLVLSALEKHEEASEWCRTRIRERGMTYRMLMEDLSETFMDVKEARKRIQPIFLQECQQGPNESIAKYNVRFKARVDLHRAACARVNRVPDDGTILVAYAAGLTHSHQRYTASRQKDWRSAMSYLLTHGKRFNEVELIRQQEDTDGESSDDEPTTKEETQSEEERPSRGTTLKEKSKASKRDKDNDRPWESLQTGLKNVTDKLGALTILVGKQQKNMAARVPGPPVVTAPAPTRDLTNVRCYNCNQLGHYSNTCPEPRKPRTLMAQKWHQAEEYGDNEQAQEFGCFLSQMDMDEFVTERQVMEQEDF